MQDKSIMMRVASENDAFIPDVVSAFRISKSHDKEDMRE